MREHLDDSDVASFSQREMSAQELLEADEHLSHCANCRRRLAAAVGWKGDVFDALPEGESLLAASPQPHLTYEQLADYVDDQLPPRVRELIEQHVADCPGCRTELEDLTQFAKDLAERVPAPGLAAVASETRRRILSFLRFAKTSGERKPQEVTPREAVPSLERTVMAEPTGRPESINLLLETYGSELRRWARGRMPLTDESVDDIVTETIAQEHSRLRSLDVRHEGAIHAYLRQAVLNRIRDHVRRKKRGNPPEEGIGPLEETITGEAFAVYERALQRLALRADSALLGPGPPSDAIDDSHSPAADTRLRPNSPTDLPERDSD